MQLVLDTNGLAVKKRNNCFWIISKKQKRQISPKRISSIAVTADCLLSSAAIKLAAQHQIPIFFFNRAAKVEARLWSPNFGSIATIRRQQVLFALKPEATDWVIDLFRLKTQHQKANFQYLKKRKRGLLPDLNERIETMEEKASNFQKLKGKLLAECGNSMMGIEGNIAKIYWSQVSHCLPQTYQFSVRSRRPAKDMFNAGLNYLYGMLYSVTGSAIMAAGLDTHLGFLHVDQHNKPTFTFDMIEPFRPWVDRLLIEQCLDNKLKASHFTVRDKDFYLSKEGKRFLIPLFNDFMEEKIRFNHRKLSRKNHIYRFAGEFAQFLLTQ